MLVFCYFRLIRVRLLIVTFLCLRILVARLCGTGQMCLNGPQKWVTMTKIQNNWLLILFDIWIL